MTPLRDAAVAGNAEAFALAYDRYAPCLYAALLRILGDSGRAQEALRKTFVAAWTNARLFDARRESELAWLAAMARSRGVGKLAPREIELAALEQTDPVPPPAAVRMALLEDLRTGDHAVTMERPLPTPASRWWIVPIVVLAGAWAVTAVQLWQAKRDVRSLQPGHLVIAGQKNAPGAAAHFFFDRDRQMAYVFFEKLPQTRPDRQYQLWVTRTDEPAPDSAGLFSPAVDGRASLVITGLNSEAVQHVVVTLEPRGGSPSPAGPTYLAGRAR